MTFDKFKIRLTMNATNGWARWLRNHKKARVYDAHPEKVQGLCSENEPEKNFEALEKAPNLVLLSKPPVGTKIQASFYHSTVGIPIMPDQSTHVARVGMNNGTVMQVVPKTLFQVTRAVHKPDLLTLMKIKTEDEFKASTAEGSRRKSKVKCSAPLTPELAEVVRRTDMTPSKTFMAITAHLKATVEV